MKNNELARELRRIWIKLSEDSVAENDIQSVDLSKDYGYGSLQVALTADGLERILIPVSRKADTDWEITGKGVSVTVYPLHNNGRITNYIDLQCLESRLSEVFILVVIEIVKRMDDGTGAQTSVRTVLDEFRELLRRKRSSLSESELLGLIGELTFLNELVDRDPLLLSGWLGPKGTIHDFCFEKVHLEVKASMRRHGRIARINSFEQLDIDSCKDLYLVHEVYEQGSAKDITVSSLYSMLESKNVDSDELLKILHEIGVEDPHAAELNDQTFRLLGRSVFHVKDSFPKMIDSSFMASKRPAGVTHCTYDVDLETALDCELNEEDIKSLFEKIAS